MRLRLIPFVCLMLWPVTAHAVIAARLQLFEQSAAVVLLKVTGANPANKVLDLEVAQVVTGQFEPRTLRLQVANPPGAFEAAPVGSQLVLFAARRGSQDPIHLADRWLLAERNEARTAWVVRSEHESLAKTYPGSTAALVRLVSKRTAGTEPLMEELHDNLIFADKAIDLGRGPAGATALAAIDIDDSGRSVLLAQTPTGLRALKLGDKVEDITDALGLKDLRGTLQAVVGGRLPTLIVDGKPYAFNGTAFGPGPATRPAPQWLLDPAAGLPVTYLGLEIARTQPWGETLAAAWGRFGDQGRPGVLVASPTAITLQPLDNGTPADFARLTGQALALWDTENRGLAHPAIRALDVNGDSLDDAVVMSDHLAFVLVNRGYGCYFAAEVSGRNLRRTAEAAGVPFGPGTCWTPVHYSSPKAHDIAILAPDGRLILAPAGKV
jgi:hypothetical protein